MEKRYQMFVSSTFSDLVAERQAVMQALLSLDLFPAGMELFPASDEDQWTLIKGVINDSDYYIILIGARYGSLSPEGVSYTEQEFEYAVSSGIPILAFLHEAPDELPAKKTDQNDAAREKLAALRDKVRTGRHVKFWRNADDLKAKVIQGVSAEIKRNPRIGWVRANLSTDPARLNALTAEIEGLRDALAQARTQAPSGAEAYAQDDDQFEVFCHRKKASNDREELANVKMSWNDIFYELGPLMMGEASEALLRRRLAQELDEYDHSYTHKYNSCTIHNDSFETIKVQLVALGLMRKSERKHVPSDRNAYWSITSYGEEYLMKLRAIKRKA